jgi:hypothetical protein
MMKRDLYGPEMLMAAAQNKYRLIVGDGIWGAAVSATEIVAM